MKKQGWFLILFFSSAVWAAAVQARAGAWFAGVDAGYMFGFMSNDTRISYKRAGDKIDVDTGFGEHSPHLGVELGYDFYKSNKTAWGRALVFNINYLRYMPQVDFHATVLGANRQVSGKTKTNFNLSLAYQQLYYIDTFAVFAELGVGADWSRNLFQETKNGVTHDLIKQNLFCPSLLAGLGFDYAINARQHILLDWRVYVFPSIDHQELPNSSGDVQSISAKLSGANFVASVGYRYSF